MSYPSNQNPVSQAILGNSAHYIQTTPKKHQNFAQNTGDIANHRHTQFPFSKKNKSVYWYHLNWRHYFLAFPVHWLCFLVTDPCCNWCRTVNNASLALCQLRNPITISVRRNVQHVDWYVEGINYWYGMQHSSSFGGYHLFLRLASLSWITWHLPNRFVLSLEFICSEYRFVKIVNEKLHRGWVCFIILSQHSFRWWNGVRNCFFSSLPHYTLPETQSSIHVGHVP